MPRLADSLPEIYSSLLPKEILDLAPDERKATCDRCYRANPENPQPHYDPQLKCCTYYPFLPNYLVGAVLVSDDEAAKTQISKLIRERQFTLPIGICAPPGYQNLFRNKSPQDYGNRTDLLCPFYEWGSGHCTIWRNRGHECATFFCMSSYGTNGEKFWLEIREILFAAEMHLSQMAMVEKGYTPREIDLNLVYIRREQDDLSHAWQCDALLWSQFWIHHLDDIVGYYKATFEFVKSRQIELRKELDEVIRTRSSKPADSRVLAALLMGGTLSENHRHGQNS